MYPPVILRGTIVNKDQILLVKIGKYIGFCVYRRSYLLWFPVIPYQGMCQATPRALYCTGNGQWVLLNQHYRGTTTITTAVRPAVRYLHEICCCIRAKEKPVKKSGVCAYVQSCCISMMQQQQQQQCDRF